MDSRSPLPEAARRSPSAERRNAWLAAITLWTAFLGAALVQLVVLLALPPDAMHALDWHVLSVLFLCSWLALAVAVALALVLARPLLEARDRDGR